MPDNGCLWRTTCDTSGMRITRVLAVAVSFAAVALGLAVPASAERVLEGVYTYTQGDIVVDWTIYPSCVPTVGDLREELRLPVACRLHVASSSPVVNGGDARLTDGRWMFSTAVMEGFTCPDGSWAPIQAIYEFDDVTMTGTRTVSVNNVCDGAVPAHLSTFPFTLAYKQPLPIPVQQYPLYCEPGGLKRCF
jgi:hypothetical protein